MVQSGTPLEMLAAPANDSVLDFFGRSDVGIKLLGLRRVADHFRPKTDAPGALLTAMPAIAATLSLREALSVFVSHRVSQLAVLDGNGQAIGRLDLQDLLAPARAKAEAPQALQ